MKTFNKFSDSCIIKKSALSSIIGGDSGSSTSEGTNYNPKKENSPPMCDTRTITTDDCGGSSTTVCIFACTPG